MRLHLILFILWGFSIGCYNPSTEKNSKTESELNIPIIDIDNALSNISNTPFKCSEFIEDIEYIPLETNNKSLLGGLRGVQILATPEFVYCDLKKFNIKTGRYINLIGKQRGRGPGEFIMAIGSATDLTDNRVFVLANENHKILVYDKDNNFIKKIDVLPQIRGISYLGDNRLILFRADIVSLYDNTGPFEYQILNLIDERIIYTREIVKISEATNGKKEKRFYSYGIGRNSNWYYDNKVQYYESFTDTIFTIEKNGKRIPRFFVNRKNNKPPFSEILDNGSFERNRPKYIEIISVFETPRYLFFNIKRGLKEGSYYARFDKLKPLVLRYKSNKFN